jgi:hypothetical protein
MIGWPDSQCSYQETRIMLDIGYPLPFQPECNRKPGLTAANDQHIKDTRLGADDHVLLLIFHHIIVDGWSIGVFMEELSELYAAFAAGRRHICPNQHISFPTSLAGRSGGPPAKQQPSSSPIGSVTCGTPHPYFPQRRTSKAPCCACALRTNQFACRKLWLHACAR